MASKIFQKIISSSANQSNSRLLSSASGSGTTGSFERSLNNVQLLGRVGNVPQNRGTELHPVVVFSMATHTNYKVDGIANQKTDWHRISVFKPGLRDNVANYLKKGQRVHVTGRISYGEIKEGDQTKTVTSIIADDVIFFS